MKKLCKAHESKVCNLHKADSKALTTNAKEGEIIGKRKVGNPLGTIRAGKTKPTLSHEDMLKIPEWHHRDAAEKHGRLAGLWGASTKASEGDKEKHKKAYDMHNAYSTHLKHPTDRTNELFVSDEQHAQKQKEAGEKAHKLHNDLSSIEVGTKVAKSQNVCDLHKSKTCELHKSKICDLHKSEEPKHEILPGQDDGCPYCAENEDNRTDDCALCQDLDAQENADGTAGMHDCDMCQNYDASKQNTGGIDDCPYCQTENITASQQNPNENVDHICNCPDCPGHDSTALEVQDQGAQRPDDCPECQEMYGEATENQPDQTGQSDPNLQGHETAEEVLNLLDQEPGSGKEDPTEEAKKIDNTELPQGDEMKGNASVKEDFGDAQKNNISDSEKDFGRPGHDCNCPNCPGSQEAVPMDTSTDASQAVEDDQPDMADVMQGGLEDHANEQKKKEVLNMVAQTLQGFKANKANLEATKEQNQPLYNSCIQMLKSMIELCKLLGLNPQEAQPQAPQDAGAVAEATQSDAPQGPKQSGPPQAAPGGAAKDPKAQ